MRLGPALATIVLAAMAGSTLEAASAETPHFARLSAEEASRLSAGETVFRQPAGWDRLAIPAELAAGKTIIEETRRAGANYIGEVLMVLPRTAANARLPQELAKIVGAVEGYKGIPYYSEKYKKVYELYDSISIASRTGTAEAGGLVATQHMKPFDSYSARYEWSARPEGLSFSSTTTTAITYKGTRAIAPGDMVWRMEVWSSGGDWVLYGIGRIRAFDMFGLLRQRISDSFMGRIEAFYEYQFSRMKATGRPPG